MPLDRYQIAEHFQTAVNLTNARVGFAFLPASAKGFVPDGVVLRTPDFSIGPLDTFALWPRQCRPARSPHPRSTQGNQEGVVIAGLSPDTKTYRRFSALFRRLLRGFRLVLRCELLFNLRSDGVVEGQAETRVYSAAAVRIFSTFASSSRATLRASAFPYGAR
jgi:hypothetical protein